MMVRRAPLFAALIVAGALAASCGQSDYDPAKAPKAEVPAASAPAAPEIAPAGAGWNLAGHIGKYPNESGLFDTSAIAPDLRTLLGDKLAVFKANMQTEGPLAKDQAVLWTSGNKDNEGGRNQAYLLIDPARKALEVGLWENGKLTTYTTPGAVFAKPRDVQTMIANAAG